MQKGGQKHDKRKNNKSRVLLIKLYPKVNDHETAQQQFYLVSTTEKVIDQKKKNIEAVTWVERENPYTGNPSNTNQPSHSSRTITNYNIENLPEKIEFQFQR